MLIKYNKKLNSNIRKMDSCNKYFSNHVGNHAEEYVRKGIIILQIVVILSILFI